MSEERKIRNDIIAVGILALIIFLAASLATYDVKDPAHSASAWLNQIYQPDQLVYPERTEVTNACGRLGAWTAALLTDTLGVGSYFLILGLVAMEISLFQRQSIESPWLKTAGWTLSILALTTLATMLLPATWFSQIIGPGGYLGALGSGFASQYLGSIGGLVIAASCFFVGMMMCTEYLVFRAGRVVFAPALVAATTVLPFGILHGFVSWFNGHREVDEEETEDDEYGEFEDEEQEIRTIRFRRHDIDATEEEPIGAPADELEEDEDEEEDEEEDDLDDDEAVAEQLDEDVNDEEYEEVEEDATPIKIAAETREPDPTLDEAEPEPAAAIPAPHFKIRKGKGKQKAEPEPTEREVVMSQLDAAAAATDSIADYELPPIEMLDNSETVPFEQQKREALKKAEILETTCKQFGYDVRVVEIETGPVISQYEIDLAPGLRLQKITALADDLAIAMRVPSVRIVAPIPGKNSVGVEVPNESRQVVRLRQVMEQSDSQIKKMKIPLFLGADAVGAPLVADLASLPHLLIAGRTGTGKSVCLNAIISSILMTRRPDEVRMLMIDPKMVELSGYGRLPHLMHPVVTDMRKAEAILAWAVDKMEERYSLLAKAGVRHVTSYNQLGKEELVDRLGAVTDEEVEGIPATLPFIVIVADEMADLMMTAGKDVEQHIIRLAQKSRAVGIHLILATQKPTVDVITGLIKSNLPARISFQVASKTDSRVVLDAQGADKLLGMGDMLFLWPGTSNLLRGQGTYLSDPEIDMITSSVSTGEQNFVHELVNIKVKSDDEESDEPKKVENRDDRYEEAISIVVKEGRGSCSLLQRAMGIGYGRAARLIDFMAEDGYVGEYNGSKAREVLLSESKWQAMLNGNDDHDADSETPMAVAPAMTPKAPKPGPSTSNGDDEATDDQTIVERQESGSSGVRKPKLKRLRRIEPGVVSHLSANSTTVEPEEAIEDESIDYDAEEVDEEDWEDEDVVAEADDGDYEGSEDDEYDDGDYEDVDDYEDVEYEDDDE
ncbi:MAG: DNA translocase FtsK [Planctomycetota bacterium]